MAVDFSAVSEKIFEADARVRGVTFCRFDGAILHFEMREGVESLGPAGAIGKMDAESLVPAMTSYFDTHNKYFGHIEYAVAKFEKISIVYLKHKNIFAIISLEAKIDTYPVVAKIKEVLDREMQDGTRSEQSS